MSPIEFSTNLTKYSNAETPEDLVSIFGKSRKINGITPPDCGRVLAVLSKFLEVNRDQMIPGDIYSLCKLHGVVTLAVFQQEVPESKPYPKNNLKNHKKLAKTIYETINRLFLDKKEMEADFVCSPNPNFNSRACKVKISSDELDEFIKDLKNRCYKENENENENEIERDYEIFKQTINMFFASAPADLNRDFFSRIKETDFLDHIISSLSPNVVHLDLSECECVTHNLIEIITNSEDRNQLECLHLNCSLLGDDAIKEIVKKNSHIKNLKKILLYKAYRITDESAEAIANSPNLSILRKLHMPRSGITDKGVKALSDSRCLPKLRGLNLSGCMVSDRGVQAIADSSHLNLKMLNLSECEDITDDGLIALAESERMKELTHLYLDDCCLLTDKSLSAIANSDHLKKLVVLHCAGCRNITDDGIRDLTASSNMSKLKYLNLSECGVTKQGISAIAESPYIKLEWLGLNGCENLICDEEQNSISEMQ